MPAFRTLVLLVSSCLPLLARAQADTAGLLLPEGPAVIAATPAAAAAGEIQVAVVLVDAPVALEVGPNAKKVGARLTPSAQRAYRQTLRAKQEGLMGRVRALGGREVARLGVALNAVVVAVDRSRIGDLAALPGVASVRPIVDYQLDLTETVPYIGATVLRAAGFDGTGVRVAVLDSGIDYTHRNLGGSGSVADFTGNDPTVVEPGTFPTGKVIGGIDFVGSRWPCVPAPSPGNCNPTPPAPLEPDADPLDKCPELDPDPAKFLPCNSGHGTHVSDIIGGQSTDGAHVGVAPGAKLYAVKVCSSVSTACSGVALLQGIEFALDPNGDGAVDDAVDVVNMSLGSSYGQRQDDLGAASANAVRLGVIVVASAGNAADRPFIVGSPSSTPEVISVAQTQVPSAKLYRITAGAVTAGGSWQTWSAAPTLVSAPLFYDTTNVNTRRGCSDAAGTSPWLTADALAGRIVLVDRGLCAISMKVSNIFRASGIAAVVANNVAQAPGDLPPDFSFGGGTPNVAGYSITLADGNALKTVLGATATIDPAVAASLVQNMVSSSSRGPSYSFAAIKPDIGAPGASVSAEFGTGTGMTAFGGTSGSVPMVSGSAALLIQAFPARTPAELKSLLMNTAEPTIGINPVALPGVPAPITRIGGGEVRVDEAFASKTAAWDADALTGSLSFGYRALAGPTTLDRTVLVRNYANRARTYAVSSSFRFPADENGAVAIVAPSSVTVPANGSHRFKVQATIDAAKLPVWTLNGGARGGDGFRLQEVEFDGFIRIQDATDEVRLAWQVLPHRSAAVNLPRAHLPLPRGASTLTLSNAGGALDGRVDVFSLTATSGRIPTARLPADGDNFAIVDLRSVGVRAVATGPDQFGVQFAVNTFGTRAHPAYPAEFDVVIDANRDGVDDFVVFNVENGAFASTGQTLSAVFDIAAETATAFFFADADLQSGNIILTAPLAALGLTLATTFDFRVEAFDNYFTGNLTDRTGPMTYTLGSPRHLAPAVFTVPARASTTIEVAASPPGAAASPSQQGLLFMYRDARPDREADVLFVTP